MALLMRQDDELYGNININGDIVVNDVIVNGNIGKVVKVVMQSNLTLINTSLARSDTDLYIYNYTPASNKSNIYIYFTTRFFFGGGGNDLIYSRVYIDGVEKWLKGHKQNNGPGGGARGDILFPISYTYENTTGSPITIKITGDATFCDDSVQVSNPFSTFKIMEYNVE
jgi:hypothetical protein